MNTLGEEKEVSSFPLYTSLLLPSPRSRQARYDLSHPYDLHRTLSRAFPELPPAPTEAGKTAEQLAADEARREVRCLFRMEEAKRGLIVLAQSRIAPDWEAITAAFPDYFVNLPEVKAWTPRFVEGQKLAFRLRANPTVKRNGKRQALLGERERLQWLARQAEAHGFTLPTIATIGGDTLPNAQVQEERVQTGETARDFKVIHNAVSFEGALRVTDPLRFAEAVASGIGSAKGFGFGLLSLAIRKA
jgi:CRISPR system Cascade subunit CasE